MENQKKELELYRAVVTQDVNMASHLALTF